MSGAGKSRETKTGSGPTEDMSNKRYFKLLFWDRENFFEF